LLSVYISAGYVASLRCPSVAEGDCPRRALRCSYLVESPRSINLFGALAVLGLVASGCARGSLLLERPARDRLDDAVTAMWGADVRAVARHGDWLFGRSYSLEGDLVAVATAGLDLSHVALYDAERGAVIEAVSPAVRSIPLAKFLARNRYVFVVRPPGTAVQRGRAVLRARGLVGAGFDYTGLLGFDDPGRFYCAELVVAAIEREPPVAILAPSEVFFYGRTIYWSGAREEAGVRAMARRAMHDGRGRGVPAVAVRAGQESGVPARR
jgi:hypothetical protein